MGLEVPKVWLTQTWSQPDGLAAGPNRKISIVSEIKKKLFVRLPEAVHQEKQGHILSANV